MISVTVNDKDLQQKLKSLKEKLKNRALAREVREVAIADILRNFKTSGRNLGEKWEKLSGFTKKRRRGGSSVPLRDTGGLQQSVKGVILDDSVEIKSNYFKGKYNIAAVQHYGVKPYVVTEKQRAWFRYQGVFLPKKKEISIPPRPFLLLSKSGVEEITELPVKIIKDVK